MKKLITAALTLATATLGAKAFEGTATYQVSGQSDKSMEMSLTLKGGLVRMEAAHEGHTVINIMDPAKKVMLMLMPEQKMYMEHKLDAGRFKTKGKAEKPKITKTGKSESIAGYQAEEWLIETKQSTMHLWGSTELGQGFGQAPAGKQDEGGWEIPAELRDKGFFVLRMTSDGKGRAGKMEATSVKPGSVDSALFKVPAGYKQSGMPGMGGEAGGMPPDAAAKMKEAMEGMSPEERAMMQKMMKGHGGH